MELPEIIVDDARAAPSRRRRCGARHYHDVLAALDGDELRALGEDYLERTRIHRKTDAPLFIDKMPNNFLHVGLIHLMLPNARIIDARRHPLACCFSASSSTSRAARTSATAWTTSAATTATTSS